jgi:excinuclease ABC subunit B
MGRKKEDTKKFNAKKIPKQEIAQVVHMLESQMELASENLEFEKAAELRDQIEELNKMAAEKK